MATESVVPLLRRSVSNWMAARASLLVLYASQTGITCELAQQHPNENLGSAAEVAARIAREADRLCFSVNERSIDEYDIVRSWLQTNAS